MKERILLIGIFLVIMAMLPVVAVKCSCINDNTQINQATDDTANYSVSAKNDDKNKILCGLVAAQYENSYCDETLRAIAILINTDYNLNTKNFDINDKDVCIFEEDADSSLKENYSKIEETVNSISELKININKEIKYIPYSDTSNGKTIENDKYDYLYSVASPWDCYCENYDKDAECVGVSLSGIDYLCKNGASAEEALEWYLPEFEVRKIG